MINLRTLRIFNLTIFKCGRSGKSYYKHTNTTADILFGAELCSPEVARAQSDARGLKERAARTAAKLQQAEGTHGCRLDPVGRGPG